MGRICSREMHERRDCGGGLEGSADGEDQTDGGRGCRDTGACMGSGGGGASSWRGGGGGFDSCNSGGKAVSPAGCVCVSVCQTLRERGEREREKERERERE